MSTLNQLLQRIQKERSAGKKTAAELQLAGNSITAVERNIIELKRRQQDTSKLEAQRAKLDSDVKNAATDFNTSTDKIKDYLAELYQQSQQKLVEQLSDSCPLLLFPVKIETKFKTIGANTELWIRIFPDDIAIHTHEELLTEAEYESGKNYWRTILNVEDETTRQGAWNTLVTTYDANRSAWIIRKTKPLNWDGHPANADALEFAEQTAFKSSSWTRAPHSRIMPDKFVASGYANNELIFEKEGNVIPDSLQLAPDPSSETPQLSRDKATGEIIADEKLAWMFDFKKAEDAGMAIRVPLKEPYASDGIDRLVVLGLRISSSAEESKALIEELIDNHHYSVDGFSFLKQGTATNNTEDGSSGYDSDDFGNEASYESETGDALFTPTSDDASKTDGQIFAEYLGISHEPLYHIRNSDLTDIKEAQLMNTALWPGTLGYFMDEMMHPVFTRTQITSTRDFFRQHVSGRGPVPAIRVGNQPYGILPTSNFSGWKWSAGEAGDGGGYYNQLHATLLQLEKTWTDLSARADYAGKAGDPFTLLLNIMGLQAGSVEFHQRIAVDRDFTWNFFNYQDYGVAAAWDAVFKGFKSNILTQLGMDAASPPKIADISFYGNQSQLIGALIDDRNELSETSPIDTYDGVNNYIQWLLQSDSTTVINETFKDSSGNAIAPPKALLYLMLRNAWLQQVWLNVNGLFQHNKLTNGNAKEKSIVNVQPQASLSKMDYLLMDMNRVSSGSVTGNNAIAADVVLTAPVMEAIGNSYLGEMKSALTKLATLPTARLERLFTEHLDLCSYRLDAWQTALFSTRVEYLRSTAKTRGQQITSGTLIGAFGWLEHIKPGTSKRTPVNNNELPSKLRDKEKVYTDSGNGGYVHGFSLNHALTGAVLRNAYLTHAEESNADAMSVNLSSERVRNALYYLDGVRNGQTLSSLLGYQFERGLHDNHPSLELDQYIYSFRSKYPLSSSDIPVSSGSEETIAASSVVDGYALLTASKTISYPYGASDLPSSSTPEATAIVQEVERMADAIDAIGDLALAESVFQIVQGNFERSGSVLKSFSEGKNPMEPQIVNTPRKGAMITNRIALLFEHDPADAVWNSALTPRANAEKGLNKWLGTILPDPENIRCLVTTTAEDTVINDEIALSQLGIQPIDAVLMADKTFGIGASEIEKRIAYTFRRENNVADSAIVEILFDKRPDDWDDTVKTFFEIMPLLKNLRDIISQRRPLHALDFNVSSEAQSTTSDNSKGWDIDDITNATATGRLDTASAALEALKDELASLVIAEPYAETAFDEWRTILRSIADHALTEAFPNSATGFTAAEYQVLRTQTDMVLTLVEDRLTRSAALLNYEPTNETLSESPTEAELMLEESRKKDEQISKYSEAARLLLGSSFTLIPRFSLNNSDEIKNAITDSSNLTRHATTDMNIPFPANEWLQGVAKVRRDSASLEDIIMYQSNIYNTEVAITPFQIPYQADDHWVAIEFPADFAIEEDKLSIAAVLPAAHDPTTRQNGFLIDDWTELIPSGKKETTGIAFHYDQPNAMPPQTLLLAVAPEIKGNWKWNDLMDILNDTLDRAKRRAVEPDHVDDSVYAQFLPAMMTAFSSHPVTISTYLAENITGKITAI